MKVDDNSKNKIIAIIITNLKGGGAEKVQLNLCREFRNKGYEVDLVLFEKVGELLNGVPNDVHIVDLKTKNLRQGFFPLVRYFRKNKPDAIVSVIWPVSIIAIWAKIFSGIRAKMIVSEHTTFSRSAVYHRPLNKYILPLTMWLSYAKADCIIGVSNGVVDDLKKLSRSKRAKFRTIYNPVCPDISFVKSVKPNNSFWNSSSTKKIIAIGNLKKAKDFITLIQAFHLVNLQTDAELLIMGEGDERSKLESLRRELNLQSNIHLPGFISNPFPFLKSSDLFVLSSAWEGLPTVMIEALACGTPVVSTNCKSGPSEILENGKYGTLVPVKNPQALADAIIDNLQKNHDPAPLIERAKFFSHEKIANEYLKLLFPKDIQFAK